MESNRAVALLSLRLILGLIFLLQGYGKVFSWGVENMFTSDLFLGSYKDMLPEFVIRMTAYYTSYVELIGGLILLFGFKTNYVLYALLSVLVIVTLGHGLAEPIWDLSHVMYRLMIIITLLLLPREWDRFSVDGFLSKRK